MLVKDSNSWNRIISFGDGYIYNDFGTQFPGDSPTWNTTDLNKLHLTRCSHVKRMTVMTEGKFTKHHFESKKDALKWLDSNRKQEGYTLCKICFR
ncbi:hypothetical protein MCGE09_00265 [Thaumarchaeota archaeon SCGC AB-539-E09]|nr:hypothetical protein MCGE09_00265 [Thaumarchaeota archaeon SCGC AB-539-E09]